MIRVGIQTSEEGIPVVAGGFVRLKNSVFTYCPSKLNGAATGESTGG
jgi:hypothetical protein